MRLALLLVALLSVGCTTGAAVAPHTDQRGQAGGPPATPARVVERARAPERGEEAASNSGAGEPAPPETTTRALPEPATLEGDVFAHCAYGPPNYGEDPGSDSQENFAVSSC